MKSINENKNKKNDSMLQTSVILISFFVAVTHALPPSTYSSTLTSSNNVKVEDVKVECNKRHMVIHIITGGSDHSSSDISLNHHENDDFPENILTDELLDIPASHHSAAFSGLVYPKGLSRNSSCMTEYIYQQDPIVYKLPLRSCNTMSSETEDGGIEYHNTIVVQPHLKLVTNQGKGFYVKCKYEAPEQMISINEPIASGLMEPKALTSIAELPSATMKIFYGDRRMNEVAENVKIGDPLTLVVALEKQEEFGLKVSDCLVRDGLGWGEQRLVNTDGCPVDGEIMGMFAYNDDKTQAEVSFQAHKFPYTQSVYYQCNVKLCLKTDGSCEQITPPLCGKNRGRRQTKDGNDGVPATIEVFSGLYVNEANDLGKVDFDDGSGVTSQKNPEDSICISQRNFAIGICVAGLILMLCVLIAIIVLMARRRNKKTSSVPGSSIYSGPYTNTAYSHSS